MPAFVGVDLGTSGVRACAIDAAHRVLARHAVALPPPRREGLAVEQDPELWWQAVVRVLDAVAREHRITALAVDGTSGTVLVSDAHGSPLGAALLYSDTRARREARQIERVADPQSAALGPGSGLAKALWLVHHHGARDIRHVLSQADWILGRLSGHYGIGDENNALKLGYDPLRRGWPAWLAELGLDPHWLPRVEPCGVALGDLDPTAGLGSRLSRVRLVSGTTDGVAGFIATGAHRPGEAVTSLGSTLILKVASRRAIFSPQHGVYSHRLGDLWLAGGASNSGGAVLRRFFTDEQLAQMTPRLRPDRPTGLHYYPLPAPGERFPHADPDLAPRMSPRPADPVRFFQAILEGIAHIEYEGYRCLHQLGAPYPRSVRSVGGGARNRAWTAIRRRRLGVAVLTPAHNDAAYGAAILAQRAVSGDALP